MTGARKKIIIICLAAILAAACFGVGVYAASNYGTSSDPLVTKSYLDSVLMPEIRKEISATSTGDDYAVITLSNGQKLTCQPGCEIMLRIGTANASGADSPALVDSTSGSTIESGAALTKNHLYMATISGNGITATASTVKVLVKGSYTIG